jgi:hypothetical protein
VIEVYEAIMPGGDQLEGAETSQDKTMIQQMDD